MAAPNMAAITASLERSFQNFSLNPRPSSSSSSSSALEHSPNTDESPANEEDDSNNNRLFVPNPDDTVLELNSHVSLPYHWEQCLDLETGEIYYINWRNGMRSTEDPRLLTTGNDGGCYSSDESFYDSEESSSESPPPSSSREPRTRTEKHHVLVVAGCKSCLMYFMVPKRVEDCPKCSGQLIHFDRAESGGGSP